ncbi:MAG TPA: GlsB/YeaQ/YmgE family stress response membrane protein [Chloroflexota bacterium]|nr:GlsB/YeaQ/YmgE family stress response membrane protein [Chloroflexota bacterium]
MPFVILILAVIIFGWVFLALIGFTLGIFLTLFVAGLVGWLADLVVPGELPGGWVGAVIAGLAGGFLGGIVFRLLGIHDPGFGLFGIDLIPAFVGAVIVAFAAELLTRNRRLA